MLVCCAKAPVPHDGTVWVTSRWLACERRDSWWVGGSGTLDGSSQTSRLASLHVRNGACDACGSVMAIGALDDHHVVPRWAGGPNALVDGMLVHHGWHHAERLRNADRVSEARAVCGKSCTDGSWGREDSGSVVVDWTAPKTPWELGFFLEATGPKDGSLVSAPRVVGVEVWGDGSGGNAGRRLGVG